MMLKWSHATDITNMGQIIQGVYSMDIQIAEAEVTIRVHY